MDPYAVLDVSPDAPPDELAAAYRRAAKRWHPDRPGALPEAERRMAEVNVAYDLLRDGSWRTATVAAARAAPRRARRERRAGGPPRGHWLPATIRAALGRELVAALAEGEQVALVTPAATWASPQTVLAVTDRRVLWLSDDAIAMRVQSVPLAIVTDVGVLPRRFRRHVASVFLRTARGGRYTFAELRPAVADELAERVRAELPAAARLRRTA